MRVKITNHRISAFQQLLQFSSTVPHGGAESYLYTWQHALASSKSLHKNLNNFIGFQLQNECLDGTEVLIRMSECVQDRITRTREFQQWLLLLAVTSIRSSSGNRCEGVRFRVERVPAWKGFVALWGVPAPRRNGSQKLDPALQLLEGLRMMKACSRLLPEASPKPRRSMMEMRLDSFACSSYCRAGLTGSSSCQPQSVMGLPASEAEAGDGLRGELPVWWLK